MSQITIDVAANLQKLQKDLKDFFRQKFNVNVNGKGQGGRSGDKSGSGTGATITGMLRGLLVAVAPLAVLAKIANYLKIFELIFAFVMTAILQIWEWVKSIAKLVWEGVKLVWEGLKIVWNWLVKLWELIKPILASLWDALTAVWTKIVEWLKVGWDVLKSVFNTIWEVLKAGWNILKAGFKASWDAIKMVWEKIVGFFNDKIKPVFDTIKDAIMGAWEILKTALSQFFKDPVGTLKKGLQFVWDSIKSLPSQIWGYMKQLGQIIADKIKGAIGNLNPFRGGSFGGGSSVDDAVFYKDGKVAKLNPNDTFFAAKNPSGMGGGTTINLYGVTSREMVDYVKKELGKDINRVGRY